MKKYIEVLSQTLLFSDIDDSELLSMLNCFDAFTREYKKGEYVFSEGDKIDKICILLSGELHIQSDDYWGNRTIISRISVGDMFGEAYSAPECEPFQNDVVAIEDSVVGFFDITKMLTVCSSSCRFHSSIIKKLFFSISEKNRTLVSKLRHVTRRTTREKLVSYLSDEAKKQGGPNFTIPFNRQQLADYLSVDRSAMSNELCKMRDEGLIEFKKNEFRLLEKV